MPGLYVHIPYCSVKCAYCDFYSGPLHGFDGATYVLATLAELESRRFEVLDSHDKKFDTIYIG
ncbi:MAG: coproporphyrinogen III oxidase family protein, partial [Muribaculaceae bacterium]|nr:coproporphyrinogen III oxidase family protein [Muribaculaceae bacterium]MDE6508816.1 coproporphyrinogen III oxidase family protein [Muribaculaceae bacterium]